MAERGDASQAELIRRIASVVGHELRNPLAVLNNSSYFIKTKLSNAGSLDPKVEKHLGIMTSEIARADRMIADMLTYSRVMELTKSRVPLAAVVQDVVEATLVPAGVKLSVKAAKAPVEVSGDEKRLSEALKKLVDNAVEAVGESGTVTVAVSRERGDAVLEVRDTGGGVKAEVAPHLGEPFRTGKPRGLGLGLAIARKIAEAHGGRLEGGSSKEGGAAFRLRLPAA